MSEERPSLSVVSVSAMEVQKVLHMNGGEGDTSYANNSLLQKMVMLKVKPILRESIAELYWTRFPEMECLKVADMGCSSGPNALLPTWEIIESINLISQQLNRKPPVLQVFLNDLPGSDFNTVFKSLPSFYERVEKEKGGGGGKCFIAGVPGSFHGRLFPDHSLHFVHSSYSLHWLSQVPKGFDLGKPLNKGNIYIAATSPPSVHKAYSDQFNRDFTAFLASRSEEMIPGGRLVITILGKNNDDDRCTPWELLGISLNDMVMEGLIEEGKLDSFDAPIYVSPSAEEVKRIIETEGSFRILRLEVFYLSWDANIGNGNQNLIFDNNARAEYVSMYFRAFAESILTSHFGDAIMEDLYKRFTRKIADYMAMGKGVHPNLKKAMVMAKPILDESIKELYCASVPDCIKIADLGCSSGPNAFMPIWDNIMESIDSTCRRLNRKPPVLQVFLSDLPGNDFNTIFRSSPRFYEKLEKEKGGKFGPCFIAGMPSSFYGRLFPDHSIHFAYSSYSLHWLSQVYFVTYKASLFTFLT